MRVRLSNQDNQELSKQSKGVLDRLSTDLSALTAPAPDGELEIDVHRLYASIQELTEIFGKITALASKDIAADLAALEPRVSTECVNAEVLLTPISKLIFADSTTTDGRSQQTRCVFTLLKALSPLIAVEWQRNLPRAGLNVLQDAVIGQVLPLTEHDLFSIRSVGVTTVERIKKTLGSYGLALGNDLTPAQAQVMKDHGHSIVTRKLITESK